MERTVAVKKLAKMIGKTFGYRIDDKAPNEEERARAAGMIGPAIEERKRIAEKRDARRQAILAADAEYQGICADYKVACEEAQRLASIRGRYKITIGKTVLGFAFSVMAEGDSWEEVIDKLENEKKAAA